MAQQAFLTPQALQFSLKQSAMLIGHRTPVRIAAFAQPAHYQGRWDMVRFDWSQEPERVATWSPRHSTHN